MSFVIQCDCGQQMTVEDQHAGQSAMCVNCRKTFQIPAKPYNPGEAALVQPVPSGVPAQPPLGMGSGGGALSKPHRGGTVLTLGILSLLCMCCCGGLFFGLPALLLGISDMNEMKVGRMDSSGYSMTMLGAVLGGIGLALNLFGGLGNVFFGLPQVQPWNHSGFKLPW